MERLTEIIRDKVIHVLKNFKVDINKNSTLIEQMNCLLDNILNDMIGKDRLSYYYIENKRVNGEHSGNILTKIDLYYNRDQSKCRKTETINCITKVI